MRRSCYTTLRASIRWPLYRQSLLLSCLPYASDLTALSSLWPSHPLPAHLEGLRCPAGPPFFSNRGDENSEDARHARKTMEPLGRRRERHPPAGDEVGRRAWSSRLHRRTEEHTSKLQSLMRIS